MSSRRAQPASGLTLDTREELQLHTTEVEANEDDLPALVPALNVQVPIVD
jgi:hypothetical protein